MGEHGLEDDDKEALASLENETQPVRRNKAHSYSHNLRTNTGGTYKRFIHPRNHSLDDDSIITKTTIGTSDDDEEFYPYATTALAMEEDRQSSSSHQHSPVALGLPGHLPVFVANGANGIFKAPVRAAVHPGRPPFLELRPHPLRETQVGKFLRTIGCTGTQLWAGQESGVRVWDLDEAYDPGIGMGGRARRGDEDASPFYESESTSPTLCLVLDCGSKLVWSGHKDGKIRSWKMDQDFHDGPTPITEGLSWQAHKGPVLSLIISSHGDLWSGSEGGVIRIWPWESIDKSLSLSPEERHMAALLVERSVVDLRTQVMVNGVCSISSTDVKCLLSDSVQGKVWAAGSFSFSLWDSRTRELVKVYNIEGQIENRVDMPLVQDQVVEDEMNVKFVSKSKKEKSQGASFLQRSRNAIKGAAGAVRRVATKGAGAFVEENKRTEAIVQTSDGMIWTGFSNGLLVQWDGTGNRLQEFHHHHYAVQCFCTFGQRLWIGYVSGMVQVLDLEGNLVARWTAHTGPVLKMVVGRGYVFSLAAHGGIRGWSISSPGPLDNILRTDLAAKELTYTREENVKLLVGTWNVGQGKASLEALNVWLGSTVSDVGIVVVGLQEVEMGAGFLAMSAAKETVGLEGSAIGQWWQDTIGKSLDEGATFERVGSRQLAGLLIAIWVRKTLRPHVGDLDVSAVACGLGRAIGNKGGVGLRIRVYDRIMCFVNCHLAAHLEAVNRRNADFDHIFRTMAFTRSNLHNTAPAGTSSSAQVARTTNHAGANTEEGSTQKKKTIEEGRPDLAEADMVLFLGDFNYRLFGISYDEARDFVSQRSFDWLKEKDQLRAEMKAGRVFQGMHEALIRFPPTYKFERGKPGLGGYDSGEKKRIPAWCDRIIYRDNRVTPTSECSLECPVVSSVLQYEACMDVVESDHKPVRCKLDIDIARIDRSVRREEFGEVMRSNEEVKTLLVELSYVPETTVSTNTITLQNQEESILKIANRTGADSAIFHIICEGQSTVASDEQPSGYIPRGSFGFPRWLEVSPAGGVIGPDQVVEVSIRHEEFRSPDEGADGGIPQSWWNENTRDKEVILLVNILGSCSTESRSHKVSVRRCYTAKAARSDSCSSASTVRSDSKTFGSKRFLTSGS